jgi:D-sedoheptulose 7-phosphate isomerase
VKDAILRKVRESHEVGDRFFTENAGPIERCARALAERLSGGGRLFVMGNGGSACDAAHVAVEFLHPIVEKRRALPAVALGADTALLTAVGNDDDFSRVFERQLAVLATPGDAALGISTSGASANVLAGLRAARSRGLLTIGFAGRDGGRLPDLCDHPFVVKAWSIHRVQETHTVLLHLLWDLVHVALGEDDVL